MHYTSNHISIEVLMLKLLSCTVLAVAACFSTLYSQDGLVPAFKLESNDIELHRLAQPSTPFNKVGRKFAILGFESGTFEAWAYPLKLLRNFEFSFFVGSSTRPIHARDIVRYVSVTPEATTITYTYQSFTLRATYVTPIDEPGAIILLKVESTEPLTIVCGFLPVLQPMWPAGIGGQYAYWDDNLKAYIISESTGNNHALVGSPAASGISYTPAHMLSDAPNEFRIEIKDPASVADKFVPIYLAGWKGKHDSVRAVYKRLSSNPESYYRKNVEHYKNLRTSTMRVQTPEPQLNLAFEWAKVAFDNLLVQNPDLGKGLIAGLGASGTSGRPGFGWFFGGDAYINSFSLNSHCAYATTRDALAFTQKWQRKDGKMAHELSQAADYIDWWGKYHYGYIHGDTTPFYLVAMYDYMTMSGDIDFIKSSWESLQKAYDWCLSTDANGDGLMDNKKAGLGGVEYGALTGIATDIFLGTLSVRAAFCMSELAQVAGNSEYVHKTSEQLKRAEKSFDAKFWNAKGAFYSYAFNDDGNQVEEISPWASVAALWNIGEQQRLVQSLEKLSSSDLTTDWGVRSISVKSKYYEPLNYNYGAVWPFMNSWVTTALFKHHMPVQAYNSLLATARHTFDNNLGYITEVFSGSHNVWPQEAVSQQGFSSAGVMLPFVRGLLGLEGDAVNRMITFAPHFPADWDSVKIENYRIGASVTDFSIAKNNNNLTITLDAKNAIGYVYKISPALSIGTNIRAVRVDDQPVSFERVVSSQTIQPILEVRAKDGRTTIKMECEPTVELLPPVTDSRTGDINKGLKIVSFKREGDKLTLNVEGLAGERYSLRVLNAEKVVKVDGATLKGSIFEISIPKGKAGEFVPHKVTILIR